MMGATCEEFHSEYHILQQEKVLVKLKELEKLGIIERVTGHYWLD